MPIVSRRVCYAYYGSANTLLVTHISVYTLSEWEGDTYPDQLLSSTQIELTLSLCALSDHYSGAYRLWHIKELVNWVDQVGEAYSGANWGGGDYLTKEQGLLEEEC